jgi:hypothetical protein
MKINGRNIILTLFLFILGQSLFANTGVSVISFQYTDLHIQQKFLLPGGSDSSETKYNSETNDYSIVSDLLDDDNETENKLPGTNICLKNTQWSFVEPYKDTPFKYQFPYFFNLSSPQFIAFRSIRI